MDANFKVPRVPLVSIDSIKLVKQDNSQNSNKKNPNVSKLNHRQKTEKQQSKSNSKQHQFVSTVTPQANTTTTTTTTTISQKKIVNKSNEIPPLLLGNTTIGKELPKLCASCSKILIDYLAPIENYIKQIISYTDQSQQQQSYDDDDPKGTNRSSARQAAITQLQRNHQASLGALAVHSHQSYQQQHNRGGGGNGKSPKPNYASNQIHTNVSNKQAQENECKQNFPVQSDISCTGSSAAAVHESHHEKKISKSKQKQYIENSLEQYPNTIERQSMHALNNEQEQHEHHYYPTQTPSASVPVTQTGGGGQWPVVATNENIKQEGLNESNENQHATAISSSQVGTWHSAQQNKYFEVQHQNQHQHHYHHHHDTSSMIQNKEMSFTNSTKHLKQEREKYFTNENQSHQSTDHTTSVSATTTATTEGATHHLDHDEEYTEEVESDSSPYAYVTIAYNNLSALNAILLANSIQYYNNTSLSVFEHECDNGLERNKKILKRYQIPMVILICDSIDGQLMGIIEQVFDKVIESKYQDAVLLNDESLGIQQYKIHLWKELAFQYEKCLFLESFTMVVGQVSNLFQEYRELSASVDCLFPDNFNCAVFVFEPNMDTYKELLRYGLQQKLVNEDAPEWNDTLDEMTLLNQFFAPKWQKLSFIYNFVRNDLTYTQLPAYFKYGENIRVVNFGNIAGQHLFYSHLQQQQQQNNKTTGANLNLPQQPWNYKFDLNKAQLEEEPFEQAQLDNFSKFYLRCFIRRLWPLLSSTITPHILTSYNGRLEWTIIELLQVLGRESGTDRIGPQQNAFTLRRKKSWVIEPNYMELNDKNEEENQKKEEEENSSTGTNQSRSQSETSEEEMKNEDDERSKDTKEYTASTQMTEEEKIQFSERSKQQWEDGRIDWMGEHRSDKIINRLKTIIKQ